MSKVFRQSRWDRSRTPSHPGPAEGPGTRPPRRRRLPQLSVHQGRVPRLSRRAIVAAEKAAVHDFDNTKFFEGCLPIEVMAHRGVGHAALRADEAGRARRSADRPMALRGRCSSGRTTLAGDHYSLVGFQTQIKWGEQTRVLRMIPGLEQAEFVRFGMIHRNTYINGPTVLTETWQTRRRRICSSPGRSPASRATSSRRRRASSRGATPRGSRSAAGRCAAAHDGDRRARLLRLPRGSGALRSDEHHLRHHAAARRAAEEPARAHAGHEHPRAGRSGARLSDMHDTIERHDSSSVSA